MNRILLLACAWAVSQTVAFSESTSLSLISFSVQIEPGTAKEAGTGLVWNSRISSFDNIPEPNGELEVAGEEVPFTHESFFFWTDPQTSEEFTFPFVIDVPLDDDENDNGLPDFFDPAVATEGSTTQGRHFTPDGKGADMTATWNRAVGTMSGTVIFDLPFFGLRFTHTYNLLNFNGLFNFTRTGSTLDGSVTLTNGFSAEEIHGPLIVTINNTNQLSYQDSGKWTNSSGVLYEFLSIDNLVRSRTNYTGLFGFQDGFPATIQADYGPWFFVVRSSDANTNGVPDLLEPASAQAPNFEIRKTSEGVEITIRGVSGKTYILETADALPAAVWTQAQTVKLSSESATVSLGAPNHAQFYRVRG